MVLSNTTELSNFSQSTVNKISPTLYTTRILFYAVTGKQDSLWELMENLIHLTTYNILQTVPKLSVANSTIHYLH